MYHRVMAALIAALLTTVGLIVGLSVPPVTADPQPKPEWAQSCANDEAVTDCTWDAKHQGNGLGKSYVVVNGNLHRVPHAVAHYLTH